MQGMKPATDSVFGVDAPFDGLTRSRHVQISASNVRYPAHHLPARPRTQQVEIAGVSSRTASDLSVVQAVFAFSSRQVRNRCQAVDQPITR